MADLEHTAGGVSYMQSAWEIFCYREISEANIQGCYMDSGKSRNPLQVNYIISLAMELRCEANHLNPWSCALLVVIYIPKADAPAFLGSVSCLAVLSMYTRKVNSSARKPHIPQNMSASQRGSQSGQSSRSHEESPSAGR